jgi:hypothetical protein
VALDGAVEAGSGVTLNGAVEAGGGVSLDGAVKTGGSVALDGAVETGSGVACVNHFDYWVGSEWYEDLSVMIESCGEMEV